MEAGAKEIIIDNSDGSFEFARVLMKLCWNMEKD